MRRYNPRKIASKRSYNTEELAKALNVHIQTVRKWRKNGLSPIEPNSHPYLFLGSDIRTYIQKEQSKKKVKLQPNELYCLKCRKGVTPTTTTERSRGIILGNGNESTMIEGTCPTYNSKVNKFSSRAKKLSKLSSLQQKQTTNNDNNETQIDMFQIDGST